MVRRLCLLDLAFYVLLFALLTVSGCLIAVWIFDCDLGLGVCFAWVI